MTFTNCFNNNKSILMEGTLGERLKREYHFSFDENIVMGNLVYSEKGTTITDAITYIDNMTEYSPICYMTNCVHPDIVEEALSQSYNRKEVIYTRFLGIQANTSPLSYEELDGAEDLKTSEPTILAEKMIKLRENNPIKIFGGCCGTDGRHMKEIARRL